MKARRNEPFAYAPIDSIRAFAGHARRHGAAKLEKLKRAVQAFGQVMPILVDDHGVIIDGHALYEVLQDLHYEDVAVMVVTGRSDHEIRALRLAVNRLSDEADWDQEKLRHEFQELAASGVDIGLTGFELPEIELTVDFKITELTPSLSNQYLPEPPPVTRAGELWLCGRHRVACSDGLGAQGHSALLNGKKATLAICRPPHAYIDIAATAADGEEPGKSPDLPALLQSLAKDIADRSLVYMWASWRDMSAIQAAAEPLGLRLAQLCVSALPDAQAGPLYREQAEFIFVLSKNGCDAEVQLTPHGRKRSNVWRHRLTNTFGDDGAFAPDASAQSRTLVCDIIRDSTKRNGVVLDVFLGTGTTLLAAEETGRTCCGAGNDAHHIDAAIRRWQAETGQAAVRESDGKPFSACEDIGAEPTEAIDHV